MEDKKAQKAHRKAKKDAKRKAEREKAREEAARAQDAGEPPKQPCNNCGEMHWSKDCTAPKKATKRARSPTGSPNTPTNDRQEKKRKKAPKKADDKPPASSTDTKNPGTGANTVPTKPQAKPAAKPAKPAGKAPAKSANNTTKANNAVIMGETKRAKEKRQVADDYKTGLYLYVKIPEALRNPMPTALSIANALETTAEPPLDTGTIRALAPHDKAGWTLRFDNLDAAATAANVKFKLADDKKQVHTLTITKFHTTGAYAFVAHSTPDRPGLNEAVCKELLAENVLGKESFWMGEEIIGKGIKGHKLMIVLKEKREALSINVYLKTLGDFTVPFRAVQLTVGPCSICRGDHNDVQCPHMLAIAHIDGVLRVKPTHDSTTSS